MEEMRVPLCVLWTISLSFQHFSLALSSLDNLISGHTGFNTTGLKAYIPLP